MSDALRIAVVGYGQVARLHAEITLAESQILHRVVGRDPDRTAAFAKEFDIAHHGTSLDEALTDDAVDAVILGSPNDVHADQARRCILAGKPVLVEIPLAMSAGGAHELADLARARGVTVMVAHTHRYLTGLRGLLGDVAAGTRRFDSVLARYLILRRDRVGSSGYVRSWTDDLLWHHMNHSTDMTLGLLGITDASTVDVQVAHTRPDPTSGKPLDITLTMTTEDGRVGTVVGSYTNETPQVCDYYLAGAGRTVFVEMNVVRDRDGVAYDPDEHPEDEEDRVLQNREFFAATRANRPAAISPDTILPAMDVLQRAQDLIS
ncbi:MULTISPECIES: Gfo/Idh/MocA family protein [unclassified Streptomyces]|uniref:Gfo/Idh/MocA family protein n=1 Tax=unclassified Streptomyces TaxID=2593676 RepID=UPI001BE8D469|nr:MULTISPECIES: Gfo/Idh/MocA family oxidoreductase [unclassified Streptomyces]MBT2408175.1 Gfo/Idh/MocA family oxidoreductase [Streptomyces sp. ISL-21]MBT2609267.1 Gfo/Idh/MocA family oxidoreductase [Streptomyces sp. ISL-87]